MKKYKVPVFSEEYVVHIFIGSREECVKEAAKYFSRSEQPEYEWWVKDIFQGRGHTFKFKDLHPLILVNGDLPVHVALATLAHEACHAMDFTSDFIQMNDQNGEFRAHGVAAIMRAVGRDILSKKKTKNGKPT